MAKIYTYHTHIPHTVSTADTEMKAGGREGERRGVEKK